VFFFKVGRGGIKGYAASWVVWPMTVSQAKRESESERPEGLNWERSGVLDFRAFVEMEIGWQWQWEMIDADR